VPGAFDDDDYRFVLDEASLAWQGADIAELAELMDGLADLLEPLADGRQAALLGLAYDVSCWDSLSFLELLFTRDRRVPRDIRVRLQQLIQKCRAIDEGELGEQDIPRPVRLEDGEWDEPSWGMSHCIARAAAGRGMSCLVAARRRESGWMTVERDGVAVEIHLLAEPTSAAVFWRGLYERESIPETAFFVLGSRAFPQLVFAPDLRFNAFDGHYGEVVPWLVRLLGALNDHFARALAEYRGNHNQVMARFAALSLDISPESPNTKHNIKAWSQRQVEYDNVTYRCEWHGKRKWNKDRVHFSLPMPRHEDRILIGLFARHLDT